MNTSTETTFATEIATAKLVALCPTPSAGPWTPACDIAVVKAEIELFNNARYLGRKNVRIGGQLVRGFAFKGSAAVAGGVARVFGRTVYAFEQEGTRRYFIARDSDRGLVA